MYIAGGWSRDDTQTVDTQNLSNSGIATNKIIITRLYAPAYNEYNSQIWRTNLEIQRHWAASFLLPIGSIFILGMIVLLMVLFKRYPHTVAAIVAAILSIIVVVTIVISFNHGPIYT
ncbi:uncharacterized protein LOC116849848 [Odontomachus brunneus]|uniref:uncharacterized protein LOC116849848 n=1 Tax=Odontomachus brunneus TaxID=486640 RepID=UPI0013F1C0B2|nr:uncharacterized protein LOC116849848 [Odontomachus brunneus]XP_032683326.1 uncharacterized protein LOC116849848 [Odontomachus brunneus]XP_032683327.1 uncharacterized protein LOC116849848 [Odontomachus brunneus]XP_032683328.1 uncharacterized protein LOC116849848 [Odontomachus brunneus]XP_032683330.1 uncharacterized protein LOC116849848 [Odontomachus brunneus]